MKTRPFILFLIFGISIITPQVAWGAYDECGDVGAGMSEDCDNLLDDMLTDPDVEKIRENTRISCDNVPGGPSGAPELACCEEMEPGSGCRSKDTCANYNRIKHKVCICALCGVPHCRDVKDALLHEHLHALQKCCRSDTANCPWDPPECEAFDLDIGNGFTRHCSDIDCEKWCDEMNTQCHYPTIGEPPDPNDPSDVSEWCNRFCRQYGDKNTACCKSACKDKFSACCNWIDDPIETPYPTPVPSPTPTVAPSPSARPRPTGGSGSGSW